MESLGNIDQIEEKGELEKIEELEKKNESEKIEELKKEDESEKSDESEKEDEFDDLEKMNGTINGTNGIKMGAVGTPRARGRTLKHGRKSKKRIYAEIIVLAILIVAVWVLFMLPTLFYHLDDVSPNSFIDRFS